VMPGLTVPLDVVIVLAPLVVLGVISLLSD
jgi:hypothetical protein